MQQQKRSLALGFLAGALGGAVGTIVLNVFQTSSLKATQAAESKFDLNSSYGEQQEALLGMFEEAHTRTADVVAGAVGLDLTRKQRRAAAPITEFAFGILCAGAYGAVAEYLPAVTAAPARYTARRCSPEPARSCCRRSAMCLRLKSERLSSIWVDFQATCCMAR